MIKYEIRQSDAEGMPRIKKGECPLNIDETELVPAGFKLDVVQNSPNLKTVFVIKE